MPESGKSVCLGKSVVPSLPTLDKKESRTGEVPMKSLQPVQVLIAGLRPRQNK